MAKNRKFVIGFVRDFILAIPESEFWVDQKRIKTDASISKLFSQTLSNDGKSPSFSENTIRTIRKNPDKPDDKQDSANQKKWDQIIEAILGLNVGDLTTLHAIQSSIRQYDSIGNNSLNDEIINLFSSGKVMFDEKLIGDYAVYRQVTGSTNVEKALLTIAPVADNTGMMFQFIRASGTHSGRFSQGRVIEQDLHYLLVGSLFNMHGEDSDGVMVMAISKIKDDTSAKINAKKYMLTLGLHSLFSNYLLPCSTRMILVRLDDKLGMKEYSAFDNYNNLSLKLERFQTLEENIMQMNYRDACNEIYVRLDTKVTLNSIESGLSNEIPDCDTLSLLDVIS